MVICTTAIICEPHSVTTCEGKEVVFTCLFDTSYCNMVNINDIQWYRFTESTYTSYADMMKVNKHGERINFITYGTGNKMKTTLTITDVRKSDTGYFWVGIPSLNIRNYTSLTVLSETGTYVNIVM